MLYACILNQNIYRDREHFFYFIEEKKYYLNCLPSKTIVTCRFFNSRVIKLSSGQRRRIVYCGCFLLLLLFCSVLPLCYLSLLSARMATPLTELDDDMVRSMSVGAVFSDFVGPLFFLLSPFNFSLLVHKSIPSHLSLRMLLFSE